MGYTRVLQLPSMLAKKSFFLFGPRGTGKSYLVRQQLSQARVFDLLHSPTFARLSRQPTLIEQETGADAVIVIDEIQKLPKLLDEVHRLIENSRRVFLLTGSSARKLRRGGANLLAGRAWQARMFPLVSAELPDFDLSRYLAYGGLPAVYSSDDPHEELAAYTGTYLREEIQAEAAVRTLEPFVAFLDLLAAKVGEEINFATLGSDCGVSPKTIRNYLQVLDDTLVGFMLPPFRKTRQRKAISRSKFYLFDVGVANALAQVSSLSPATERFGHCFEHFMLMEIRAYLSYRRRSESIYFWKSQSGFEVDIVIPNQLAIEVKSTEMVQPRHLRGLQALREEGLIERFCVVSRDPEERTLNQIRILPWRQFLRELWRDQLWV